MAQSGGSRTQTGTNNQQFNAGNDIVYNNIHLNHLATLQIAVDARFDSRKQDLSQCLAGTRVELLKEIYTWAERTDSYRVLWLRGQAGTGKSTIARTIARELHRRKIPGASFFFGRGGGDTSSSEKFVATIAQQLCRSVEGLAEHIDVVLARDQHVTSLALEDQWTNLILEPLSRLVPDLGSTPIVLIIDALDECGDGTIPQLLRMFTRLDGVEPFGLRVFFTARPESTIRNALMQNFVGHAQHRYSEQAASTEYEQQHAVNADDVAEPNSDALSDLQLDEQDHANAVDLLGHQEISLSVQPSVHDDIELFFTHNFRQITLQLHLPSGWPGEKAIRTLTQLAGGLFIYAATAYKFIQDGRKHANSRLENVLTGGLQGHFGPEKRLDEIYNNILQSAIPSELDVREMEQEVEELKVLLGSIVLLLSPLSVKSLSSLLQLEEEGILATLDELHSVLDIPEDRRSAIRLQHPSFRDFLLDPARCLDRRFCIDEPRLHAMLAQSSIELLESVLVQDDLCACKYSMTQSTDIRDEQLDKCLPEQVQYACKYWIDHFCHSGKQLADGDDIHRFLQTYLLRWLEALAWLGRLSQAAEDLARLQSKTGHHACSHVLVLIQDAGKFTRNHIQHLSQYPLQIYTSASIFTPADSAIRRHYQGCLPHWLTGVPRLSMPWVDVIWDLFGHRSDVTHLVFSHDSKILVSASRDHSVKLWNAVTGRLITTFEGHAEIVSVAISNTGNLVATVSAYKHVTIWNVASGQQVTTIWAHRFAAIPITFTNDSKILGLASIDGEILLYDTESWQQIRRFGDLDINCYSIDIFAISRDNTLLAASGKTKAVRVWDVKNGKTVAEFTKHMQTVVALRFDEDNKSLSFISKEGTLRILSLQTGRLIKRHRLQSEFNEVLALSPDGSLFAGADWIKGHVKIWDVATQEAKTTIGHTTPPTSSEIVVIESDHHEQWSSEVVAISEHATEPLESHPIKPDGRIDLLAISPDNMIVATVGSLNSAKQNIIQLWNSQSAEGSLQAQQRNHQTGATSVKFSDDGKFLASGTDAGTTVMWHVDSESLTIPNLATEASELLRQLGDSRIVIDRQRGQAHSLPVSGLRTCAYISEHGIRHRLEYPFEVVTKSGFVHVMVGSWSLLVLPAEYTPQSHDIYKNKLAFGLRSGQVMFLTFDVEVLETAMKDWQIELEMR